MTKVYDKKVKEIAIKMVKELKWSRKRVSEFLGIGYRTVVRWCREAGISRVVNSPRKSTTDEGLISFIKKRKVVTYPEIEESFGNVYYRLIRLVEQGVVKRYYVPMPRKRYIRRQLLKYCKKFYYFIDERDFENFLNQLPRRPEVIKPLQHVKFPNNSYTKQVNGTGKNLINIHRIN